MKISEAILSAATALQAGRCVAMPTETVYGLAARIDLPDAISSIFHLKQRPSFDPLIVHIENFSQVHDLASEWSDAAAALAAEFWPGPLTLVVQKKDSVNSMITAGLDSVGIRMPNHPLALALIKAACTPLAAPSANRFGRTSPTSAAHVQSEFPEAIARGEITVLDGGPSDVGLESTVCRVTATEVSILRPGAISEADLKNFFTRSSDAKLRMIRVSKVKNSTASPGHTDHHYETKKPLIVSWADPLSSKPVKYEVEGREISVERIHVLNLPSEPTLAARALYSLLREGDQDPNSDALFIQRDRRQSESRDGMWEAIDDRLSRASRLQLNWEQN